MKILRFCLALFAAVCLTACLDVEKTITVNPDGSGTVVETVLMSKAALDQMKGMTAAMGGKDGAAKDGMDFADEKKAKETAAKMGEGVTLVSVKKISNQKGEGATTTYAFKDINQLKVDQSPSSGAFNMPGAEKPKVEAVSFAFNKGTPAQLTIKLPTPELAKDGKPEVAKADEAADPAMEEMGMQMMKQMFKDMRMRISVVVAGKISQTSAEFHDASRVTLMEMDFNKLLANPAQMKAMTKAKPETIEAMKTMVKGVDGIKVETAPEVTIKFQ